MGIAPIKVHYYYYYYYINFHQRRHPQRPDWRKTVFSPRICLDLISHSVFYQRFQEWGATRLGEEFTSPRNDRDDILHLALAPGSHTFVPPGKGVGCGVVQGLKPHNQRPPKRNRKRITYHTVEKELFLYFFFLINDNIVAFSPPLELTSPPAKPGEIVHTCATVFLQSSGCK